MNNTMRSAVIAGSIACLGCVCLAWTPSAGAQGRGRGPWGGDMGDARDFEAMWDRTEAVGVLDIAPMWAVLSFESGASAEALDSLREPFSRAWQERASVLKDTEGNDKVDWEGIKRDFTKTKEHLDEAIKAQLSLEAFQHYQDGMAAIERSRPRGRGLSH